MSLRAQRGVDGVRLIEPSQLVQHLVTFGLHREVRMLCRCVRLVLQDPRGRGKVLLGDGEGGPAPLVVCGRTEEPDEQSAFLRVRGGDVRGKELPRGMQVPPGRGEPPAHLGLKHTSLIGTQPLECGLLHAVVPKAERGVLLGVVVADRGHQVRFQQLSQVRGELRGGHAACDGEIRPRHLPAQARHGAEHVGGSVPETLDPRGE